MVLTTAKIQAKGIRPLLFHAFREEVLTQTKKKASGTVGNNPEEWKQTVQMDSDRRLFVTHLNLFAMIKNAAKHTKIGRGTIKDKVGATLQVPQRNYFLTFEGKDLYVPDDQDLNRDEEKPVFLHVCSVKNPATKGRNMRYRIAANIDWELEFLITWDERVVSKDMMVGVIEDAGVLEGFMDGRNIGYGRFEMKAFEVLK